MYHEVSVGNIHVEEEGSVVYLVARHPDGDSVCSLSKLKTADYRIYRKL